MELFQVNLDLKIHQMSSFIEELLFYHSTFFKRSTNIAPQFVFRRQKTCLERNSAPFYRIICSKPSVSYSRYHPFYKKNAKEHNFQD